LIGTPTAPALASTTSEPPVTVIPVTVVAGRLVVVPPVVTAMSVPDAAIVVAPEPATAHAWRNVIVVAELVMVIGAPLASVDAIEAVTLTIPYVASETVTVHVPSLPVTHDAPPLTVPPPVCANLTVAPIIGAPPLVTVAVTVTGEPASA
jgi:hypothetical protein